MKREIIFLPEASEDISEAIYRYNVQMPGLGRAFLAEVNRQILRIGWFPESYPLLKHPLRRANMRRFPYAIVYRIQPNAIAIISVFHFKTNRTQ